MSYYLFLDTETGGLSDDTSLLELGLIITDEKFNIIEEISWKLKPENDEYIVTAQALQVNKINLIQHDMVAYKYKDIKTPLHIFLHKHWSYNRCKPLIPVGKNVTFDVRRLWGCVISRGHWESMVSYQPLEINGAWRLLELQGKVPILSKTSLSHLVDHFNIPVDDNQLHGAIYDCRLGIEIMKRLVQL